MKNLVFTILAAGLLVSCASKPAATPDPNPVLTIEGGQVQGIVDSTCVIYKGIPYAAPPVGDLRWKAPQPVVAWDTVMQADHFRNAGPQGAHNPNDGNYGTEFFAEDAPFSEDCLQLNIWAPLGAPGNAAEKLPVALWIHGGGYQAGWSFEPEMDGEAWAQRGVILVTANYRLGVFGYFSHPLLTAEAGTSGNYGLMDQIAALKWVKNNIAQFGGDPDNVMIFGQSAGGGSVRCMIMSPESRDLISSAVVMSAGGIGSLLAEGTTQEQADALGKEIMDMAGLTSLDSLRAASYERLQAAMYQYMAAKKTYLMLAPHIDGKYITETFDQAAYNNDLAKTPLMFGSVANDMMGLDQGFDRLAQVRDSLGNEPTYIYRFDAPLPTDGRPALEGSFHSSELWYVFHTQKRSWRPFGPADEELSNSMVDAWTNMAKNHNPGFDKAPYVQQFKRNE